MGRLRPARTAALPVGEGAQEGQGVVGVGAHQGDVLVGVIVSRL